MLYAAYIGIDWADQKHDICLYDPTTEQFEFSVISSQSEARSEADPYGVATWAKGLGKRFNGGAIAICTEQNRGSLIYALCKYEFLVLYPINAQTGAKYRQAFAPSRVQSDRLGCNFLAKNTRREPEREL